MKVVFHCSCNISFFFIPFHLLLQGKQNRSIFGLFFWLFFFGYTNNNGHLSETMLHQRQAKIPVLRERLQMLRYTQQHCWTLPQQRNWWGGNQRGQITQNWSHPTKWLQWLKLVWARACSRQRKKRISGKCIVTRALGHNHDTEGDQTYLFSTPLLPVPND